MPGSPESVRALPSGPDGVMVSWLAPSQRGGKLTHYTLYTRELGKYAGPPTVKLLEIHKEY